MYHEIKNIKSKHKELGSLDKSVIIYYNSQGREISREGYIDQDETPVKEGYTTKLPKEKKL